MTEQGKDEKLSETPSFELKKVTEKDILTFGKWIIGGAAAIFVVAMISNLFVPSSNIFDVCKTILPPIVTLIIGYYFRHSK